MRMNKRTLSTAILAGSAPLPALMPQLLADPRRRRAVAFEIGRMIGALHAAGDRKSVV